MKVLYVCSNDGSDMRINKEVKSLSRHFEVYFLGVGESTEKSFAAAHCTYFELIPGKRNSPGNVLRHVSAFLRLNRKERFDSIHVINEQLMIFFYPFLFGKHVVLDLFDSFFLMHVDKPGEQWRTLKNLVYAPVSKILVTDQNRFELMNRSAQSKTVIVPNYPHAHPNYTKDAHPEHITIFYNGTMNEDRGTDILIELLQQDSRVRVIMAGWITDAKTEQLAKMSGVEFRGVLKQEEALQIAAKQCDYVLCVYAPNSEIHINASPNKIFDAIQTNTPVIINAEVKVSSFVEKHHLGFVMPNYYQFDGKSLAASLFEQKGNFHFDESMRQEYTWEAVEHVLIEAHCR
jgi:hypothetical protein